MGFCFFNRKHSQEKNIEQEIANIVSLQVSKIKRSLIFINPKTLAINSRVIFKASRVNTHPLLSKLPNEILIHIIKLSVCTIHLKKPAINKIIDKNFCKTEVAPLSCAVMPSDESLQSP